MNFYQQTRTDLLNGRKSVKKGFFKIHPSLHLKKQLNILFEQLL